MDNGGSSAANSTESLGEGRMHIIEIGEDGVRHFTFEGKEIKNGFKTIREGFRILKENYESGFLGARLALIGLTRLLREWGIIEYDEMRLRRGRRRGRIVTIGRVGSGRFIFLCNGVPVDSSEFTDAGSGVKLVRRLHLSRFFNEGERNQAFNQLALNKDLKTFDKEVEDFEKHLRKAFTAVHHGAQTELRA